jgi:hypothetical protein
LTVVHTVDRQFPGYWGLSEGDPSPTYKFNLDALATGDVVAKFDFGGAPPPPMFDPNLKLTIALAEAEADWAGDRSLVAALDSLCRAVTFELNMHIVRLMKEKELDWV